MTFASASSIAFLSIAILIALLGTGFAVYTWVRTQAPEVPRKRKSSRIPSTGRIVRTLPKHPLRTVRLTPAYIAPAAEHKDDDEHFADIIGASAKRR